MKKTIGLLLVVGLLVGILATAAFAAAPGDGIRDLIGSGNGHAWGANADDRGVNNNFVDADGDGICDKYVDADNDGINDLRGTLGAGGYGPHGSGACDGSNFVDSDGDGVCDNAGSGGGQQRMGGNRQGGAR